MLIGAIVAHLGEEYSWNILKKSFKNIQVLLLLKNNGYMDITLLLKIQMLMK